MVRHEGVILKMNSLTPLISSSSISLKFSLSSLTPSTVYVSIVLDPEVLVFCDDPHTSGPRKLALKLYNPNDFHIRFESKFNICFLPHFLTAILFIYIYS